MITKILPKYIQKSNFFLYPQLGMRRGSKYKPQETYVAVKDTIHPATCALICEYRHYDSKAFQNHLNRLKENAYYMDYFDTEDYVYVVFNFTTMEKDFMLFLQGSYSKFSEPFKQKVLDFFSQGDLVTEYVESYLYPELYYEEYAKILNISELDLSSAIELCDKPDLKKETLILQSN